MDLLPRFLSILSEWLQSAESRFLSYANRWRGLIPAPTDHLTADEVAHILKIVEEDNAVVVGGQSINIWAQHYAGRDPELAKLGPLTSKDIDFFRNTPATLKLEHALGGQAAFASLDDHTPNAAVVTGVIGTKIITIDFMQSVQGVPDRNIQHRYVTLTGAHPATGERVSILVMHPLDNVSSRLANVNTLRRSDAWSLRQLDASFAIVRLFVDEMIKAGATQVAQRMLMELGEILRTKHIGNRSHQLTGSDKTDVMAHFDSRPEFDIRWRQKRLIPAIVKLRDKAVRAQRRVRKSP
jgi:hypothetical protein